MTAKQSMTELLIIGRILKPRGLLGEVKAQVLTNRAEMFSKVENVEKVSFSGGFAYLKFKNINSFEEAEKLRGHLVRIPREFIQLESDEILADDLIGFEVIAQLNDESCEAVAKITRKKIGEVRKVESIGASEVINCGTLAFPYEDSFVIETNMTKRQIIVKAEMLIEEEV